MKPPDMICEGLGMLAQSLEKMLNDVFQRARSEGAEFVGVEHLLRALLSDPACRDALSATEGKIAEVEKRLDEQIASQIPSAGRRAADVQPTLEFQRTLQRAIFQVQTAGEQKVGTMSVLGALLGERNSVAVRILAEQGFDRKALLRQLGGDTGWADIPANASAPQARTMAHAVHGVRTSQPEMEKRLDALEAKVDTAIDEIRDLTAKLTQLIERLPPKD